MDVHSFLPSPPPPSPFSDSLSAPILRSKIMIAALITLLCVVFFVLLLHLYVRWLWWRNPSLHRMRIHRIASLNWDVNQGGSPYIRGGLEKELIEKLPTFTYGMTKRVGPGEEEGKGLDGVKECAVCLCEFQDNENGRLLPLCGHSFHTECIDMWLDSHSTCPLCRAMVVDPDPPPSTQVANAIEEREGAGQAVEHSHRIIDMPTNFTFWGPSSSQPRVAMASHSQPPSLSDPTPWPSSPLLSLGLDHSPTLSPSLATSRPLQSSRPRHSTRRSLPHIRIDVPSSPRSISFSRCPSPLSDQAASPLPSHSPIRSPGLRMAIKRILSRQPSRGNEACGCSHDHEQGAGNVATKDHTPTLQDDATLHTD